jgi:hypothetical protein
MTCWLKRLCDMASKGLGQILTKPDNAMIDIERVGLAA